MNSLFDSWNVSLLYVSTLGLVHSLVCSLVKMPTHYPFVLCWRAVKVQILLYPCWIMIFDCLQRHYRLQNHVVSWHEAKCEHPSVRTWCDGARI